VTFSDTTQLHPHYDLQIHLFYKLKHLESFLRFLSGDVCKVTVRWICRRSSMDNKDRRYTWKWVSCPGM